MRRRDLLAGAAGLGVAGLGAGAVYGGVRGGDDAVAPVDLPRIEAPGSPPGTETVPEPGRVTLVEVFATWCSVCARSMAPLREVAASAADAQVVSVTNEPVGQTVTEADVADWWREHGGDWPVAYDPELTLTERLDAAGVPYTVVLDAENRIVSTARGHQSAERLRERIAAAR